MAVLVEGISVVVRRASIEAHVGGGWKRFLELVPNATLCRDDDLARVGFLTPNEVGAFVDALEAEGLTFLSEGGAVDLAIADQQQGITTHCEWLEFARLGWGENRSEDDRVGACWLWDQPRVGAGTHYPSEGLKLATPAGWQFEGSLSHQFAFMPSSGSEA